jgi:hypothetical protein
VLSESRQIQIPTTVCTVENEEAILDAFEEGTFESIREVSQELNISKTSVH